uniref:Alpha-N-acetylglucosaminidase tim-barrel domain-containing protein n=1 Tax=Oryza punctata TaxID=4537 RepID=A0A0E0L9A2_ORYPU
MPIKLESSPAAVAGLAASLSSATAPPVAVGRDGDIPAATAQWEWDGEVLSLYKGPFDALDSAPGGPALQSTVTNLSDTFSDNTPPINEPAYISSLGSAIYEAMSRGNKDAVWLMQDYRKGVSKFYNGSFAELPDSVIPSPPENLKAFQSQKTHSLGSAEVFFHQVSSGVYSLKMMWSPALQIAGE